MQLRRPALDGLAQALWQEWPHPDGGLEGEREDVAPLPPQSRVALLQLLEAQRRRAVVDGLVDPVGWRCHAHVVADMRWMIERRSRCRLQQIRMLRRFAGEAQARQLISMTAAPGELP